MKKHKTSLTLSERQTDILKNEADRLGISMSEFVRRLVDAWVETQPKEIQS